MTTQAQNIERGLRSGHALSVAVFLAIIRQPGVKARKEPKTTTIANESNEELGNLFELLALFSGREKMKKRALALIIMFLITALSIGWLWADTIRLVIISFL